MMPVIRDILGGGTLVDWILRLVAWGGQPSGAGRLQRGFARNTRLRNDEARLVADALGGRARAMDALIRRLKPEILKVARLLSRDQDEVDALAERIFLRVFRSLSGYVPGTTLSEWSVHTAVAAGLLEAGKFERDATTVWDWNDEDVALLHAVDEGRGQVSPDDAAGLLDRLLDRLTPAERLVKRLLDLEGDAMPDVCRWTGWSESKVARLAERAGRRVDEMLETMCGDRHAESH